MNVILIGYRASGKTSVGRLLAERLGQRFVDVDHETLRAFDVGSIAEVWRRHGEPAWREAEVAATRRLMRQRGLVIALGGGTLMQPAAREAVESAEDTARVYLHADATTLHQRIAADSETAATRPSLTPLGGGLEEVRAVLAQREPVYRAVADHVVDVTELGIDAAAEAILKLIQQRERT